MSARVFNPLVMSEMRRMIGRSSSDSAAPAAVTRVRRDLFGPVNHEDSKTLVDKELAAIRNRDSERWGFDFIQETPIDNHRIRWERVTPEENIPEVYLRRLSFLGQQSGSLGQPSSNTKSEPTTQRPKPTGKQPQITDFLKCRKRSLSASDASIRKVGGISSRNVGTATSLSEPTKRKRSKTRQ